MMRFDNTDDDKCDLHPWHDNISSQPTIQPSSNPCSSFIIIIFLSLSQIFVEYFENLLVNTFFHMEVR